MKLLSTHGRVLLCVIRHPELRLRDIADRVGVTERTAHSLISDLVSSGYLRRHRHGARNRYELEANGVGHPLLRDEGVRELAEVLARH